VTWSPDWTHLVVLVVSWLLGALGIGYPIPPRIANK
jgi:hypothetical protein